VTFTSLERQRARQRVILRWLGRLRIGLVPIVLLAGASVQPRAGLHGERLVVLLALIGFSAGTLAVMAGRGRQAPAAVKATVLAVLTVSAGALVWLQPNGPGFLGQVLVAVSVATLRPAGWVGGVAAGLVLLTLVLIRAAVSHRPLTLVLMSVVGVMGFFIVALLVHRLREGQDQAERLLRELERTRAAQARAAVLGERQRLAREMHDVLAHSLSGLVLQLEAARLLASQQAVDPRLAGAVERAQHLARAGLEEARRAIATLRDEEVPGGERLEALAAELERDLGVPCRVEVAGERRALEPEARLTLYRVAQEALTNIRRHAHPQRVELCLGYEPLGTRLTIEDFAAPANRDGDAAAGPGAASLDGDAPAAASGDGDAAARAVAAGGYGLTGMRERAELLGGSLAAAPTGSGFRVELWVPS
jgi:signal transduction histidine kinase